jgi:hypothetical protein
MRQEAEFRIQNSEFRSQEPEGYVKRLVSEKSEAPHGGARVKIYADRPSWVPSLLHSDF